MPHLNGTKGEMGSVENKKDLFASMEWEGSRSIVLLLASCLANLFALISLFTWVRYYLAHHKKSLRPWMADMYVIFLLSVLALGIIISGDGNVKLLLVIFTVYALADAIGSVIGDVVISPTKYSDKDGPYISVYNGPRWLVLAFLNVIEVILCFAILFLYYGKGFEPSIDEPITAIYFSLVTFVSLGYGDFKPIFSSTKMLVWCEIFSFILFLVVRVPAAVTVLRVKEEASGPAQLRENEFGKKQG